MTPALCIHWGHTVQGVPACHAVKRHVALGPFRFGWAGQSRPEESPARGAAGAAASHTCARFACLNPSMPKRSRLRADARGQGGICPTAGWASPVKDAVRVVLSSQKNNRLKGAKKRARAPNKPQFPILGFVCVDACKPTTKQVDQGTPTLPGRRLPCVLVCVCCLGRAVSSRCLVITLATRSFSFGYGLGKTL